MYSIFREGLLVEGRRVRLDAVKVGGRWFVYREALERFLLQTRGPAATELASLRIRAHRARDRAARGRHRQAVRTLQEMGALSHGH